MKLPRLILPLALAAFIAVPAYAQSGGPREACKSDAQTFCKDIQPGGGRILDCLKDHYKQLSDGCYQTLQGMASRGEHGGKPPQGGPPKGNPPESATPAGMQDEPPPPPEDDDSGSDQNSRE